MIDKRLNAKENASKKMVYP